MGSKLGEEPLLKQERPQWNPLMDPGIRNSQRHVLVLLEQNPAHRVHTDYPHLYEAPDKRHYKLKEICL